MTRLWYTVLLLLITSELTVCALGIVKVYQLRKLHNKLLWSFGLMMAGIFFDKLMTLYANQYRPLILNERYTASIIAGRSIGALCVIVSVCYLLGLRND